MQRKLQRIFLSLLVIELFHVFATGVDYTPSCQEKFGKCVLEKNCTKLVNNDPDTGCGDKEICCEPTEQEVEQWETKDYHCWDVMGQCKYNLTTNCDYQYAQNKCGGPPERMCCAPDASKLDEWKMSDTKCLEDYGHCQHMNSPCDGNITGDECGGPTYRKCCEPYPEVVEEWEKNDTVCIQGFGDCQLRELDCDEDYEYVDGECGGPSDRDCCSPPASMVEDWTANDKPCLTLYGNCQHESVPCFGVWHVDPYKCGGPADRKCCHPDQSQKDVWAKEDHKCWDVVGNCQNNLTICDEGHYAVNKCGGPPERLCCVPDSTTVDEWEVNDVECLSHYGTCQHMNASCDGVHANRECGGPYYRECCEPAPEEVAEWEKNDTECIQGFGDCQLRDVTCDGDYHFEDDKCGGPSDRDCCAPLNTTLARWELNDEDCLLLYGNCQHTTVSCYGDWHWHDHVCGGPDDRRCCYPKQEQVDEWATGDHKCWDVMGNCQNSYTICIEGNYAVNKCAGPPERQCCVPDKDALDDWETRDGECSDARGICQHKDAPCENTLTSHKCGGPDYRQCCEPGTEIPDSMSGKEIGIIVFCSLAIAAIAIGVAIFCARRRHRRRYGRNTSTMGTSDGVLGWTESVGYKHMGDKLNLTENEMRMAQDD